MIGDMHSEISWGREKHVEQVALDMIAKFKAGDYDIATRHAQWLYEKIRSKASDKHIDRLRILNNEDINNND